MNRKNLDFKLKIKKKKVFQIENKKKVFHTPDYILLYKLRMLIFKRKKIRSYTTSLLIWAFNETEAVRLSAFVNTFHIFFKS